jgi:hypothetical protein
MGDSENCRNCGHPVAAWFYLDDADLASGVYEMYHVGDGGHGPGCPSCDCQQPESQIRVRS